MLRREKFKNSFMLNFLLFFSISKPLRKQIFPFTSWWRRKRCQHQMQRGFFSNFQRDCFTWTNKRRHQHEKNVKRKYNYVLKVLKTLFVRGLWINYVSLTASSSLSEKILKFTFSLQWKCFEPSFNTKCSVTYYINLRFMKFLRKQRRIASFMMFQFSKCISASITQIFFIVGQNLWNYFS